MKIRLAKKIMKCEIPDVMLDSRSLNELNKNYQKALKASPYWTLIWGDYACWYKTDHRITKAISLTSKKKK